jgi:O-antigen ligase
MRPFLERLGRHLPAAVGLALPLLFIPFAVDSYILPRASVVIAGACLGVAIGLTASRGAGLGSLRLPLLAAAIAALLAFATSTNWAVSLVGSYTRYESLPVRLSYLGLFVVPVWLLRKESDRDWLVAAFVLGTAIASLEGIAQWFLLNVAQTIDYRPDGNLGNANLLGALIAMATPLAIVRALRNDTFVVAWWGAVAVLAAGLAASSSRSGGLGALAGCLVLVVLALRGRSALIALAVAAGLVAAALVAIVISPLGVLNDDPAQSRIQLWPDALRMIAARPLTGWGPDTTGLVFGRYLSADWSPGITFDRAHSGPLDIAAMLGVVGLAALTSVLVTFIRGVWRWRFTDSVAALASACAGYTVWVAFNFDWAPATGVFWLLAGAAWSGVRLAEAQPVTTAKPLPAWVAPLRSLASAGLALAFIGLAVLPVLADAWYYQSRAELSVKVDPLQSRYHWALGQELIAAGNTEDAAAEFRRAADLGETEPQLYVDLGDADAELGDKAQARRDYERALIIDPFYAPAKQRLAGLGTG